MPTLRPVPDNYAHLALVSGEYARRLAEGVEVVPRVNLEVGEVDGDRPVAGVVGYGRGWHEGHLLRIRPRGLFAHGPGHVPRADNFARSAGLRPA
jgi:hypothetical protein